jgi:hypothetical protein
MVRRRSRTEVATMNDESTCCRITRSKWERAMPEWIVPRLRNAPSQTYLDSIVTAFVAVMHERDARYVSVYVGTLRRRERGIKGNWPRRNQAAVLRGTC